MKINKTGLASSLAVLPLIALAYSALGGAGGSATAATHAQRQGTDRSRPLACSFDASQHGAYRLESSVHDTRAPGQEDAFTGVLSWEVAEQLSGGSWRLRAALTDVEHGQSLTLPEERVSGSLDAPFFMDVDASCRFVGFGFDKGWSARKRQLVQTIISTWEHVLPADPGATHWRVEQSDGMGAFEASYTRLSGDKPGVRRVKAAYKGEDGARALGLSMRVLGSRSTARFDHGWVLRAAGREHMRIETSGELQADLVQRFSVVRDDARFKQMPKVAPSAADFSNAFAMSADPSEKADPKLAHVPFKQALSDFLALFQQGEVSHAAARQLAAWLRANPSKATALLAALRANQIPNKARPALFLALELSGADESRSVLSNVLNDESFESMDRARAASALSDIGEPTLASAEQLRARSSDEGVVGDVSLLGLGHMGQRAQDDELRGYVRDELTSELDSTADKNHRHVVLDAIGNSGDASFVEPLSKELQSDDPVTRRHAANALGRMDPDSAAPALLEQLQNETDPENRAAMVRALKDAKPTSQLIDSLSSLLDDSSSSAERRAAIEWLGSVAKSQPAARNALAAHYHTETDARLKQLIGTFLPAAALR